MLRCNARLCNDVIQAGLGYTGNHGNMVILVMMATVIVLVIVVIGASLSEPHLVVSTAALSICTSI